MDRRTFIKKSVGAGIAAGATISLGSVDLLFGSQAERGTEPFDLVAVRNGEPEPMFDRAIESIGGMQKFVKRGQMVVVKPNMAWDVPPERGANTHPGLVGRIVEHCIEAGAKDVYVFDHTCDHWIAAYRTSGIEAAARAAGAKVVPGNDEPDYREVQIPGATRLITAKVHELIIECDVFINVPVLKHHASTQVTIAMKNLMGIVWDRRFWHRNDLHRCIAEFVAYRKPDLNIVDAYRVMMRNGPRGVSEADISLMRQMVVSTDIVAADAAATRIFGSDPANVQHIVLGHDMEFGTKDLQSLSINRIVL